MKNEKVMLDIKSLRRTKMRSLEIASDLNDALIEIFIQNIKSERPRIKKEELIEELRKRLFLGRRDS